MDQETLTREVEELCTRLREEPVFHMSLGAKELFHSNFIAWLAMQYPQAVAAALAPWTEEDARAQGAEPWREWSHIDLILRPPGRRPVAIENKMFSVPSRSKILEDERTHIAKLEAREGPVSRVLLVLTEPTWAAAEPLLGWHVVSYAELVPRLLEALAASAGRPFEQELVRRYAKSLTDLMRLTELLGDPDPDLPLLLPGEVDWWLRETRIHAGIHKLRASRVAARLRSALGDAAPIHVASGFTNGMPLLDVFVPDDSGRGDHVGWQLQGQQFRLAVIVNRSAYDDAKAYVDEHFSDWFDFEAVCRLGQVSQDVYPKNGGYAMFRPNFVYRYVKTPAITPRQIAEASADYVGRAVAVAR